MALTLLHAGGKFGGGGYKVSGGLHGVGVSVVNALSTVLVVEVKNRGHLWRQSFQLGVPDAPLEQVRPLEDGEGTGTTVTWWASEEIFETTTYNLETLTNRMREYAFLNKGSRSSSATSGPRPATWSTPSRTTPWPPRSTSPGRPTSSAPTAAVSSASSSTTWAGRLRRPPQPQQEGGQPLDHLLRGPRRPRGVGHT
jgi:hypothetical protein